MLKGIKALTRVAQNLGKGALICLTEKAYPLAKEVEAIPVNLI